MLKRYCLSVFLLAMIGLAISPTGFTPEQKIAAVLKSASDFTRDEKVKSDGEGTLKQGAGGGDVLKNVLTSAAIGQVGVTIAILGGLAKLGGSVAAGILLTKGKEVRLDQSAVIRLKLVRAVSIE